MTSLSLAAEYVWEHYPTAYGRSINLARKAKEDYDAALAQYDVLIMPTIAFGARRQPPPNAGPWEAAQRTGMCNIGFFSHLHILCPASDIFPPLAFLTYTLSLAQPISWKTRASLTSQAIQP